MVKSDFKVIISGGSISGLTLANMLQLHDIDFVVLEAYEDIAPQVGASIGILPHGNRIMHQLGLYEKIKALCPPLDSFHFRDDNGHVVSEFFGVDQSMRERHGFSINFLDRQQVLQVLYDNIQDKSKVHTNKRVARVDMNDNGVAVRTTDGSVYKGDILIASDGIHSVTRKEMWRLADEETPGWIPAEEKQAVPVDTKCIFGISGPCAGIEPGASNSVFRDQASYTINGGPEGRVYWFYFEKLPKTVYGDEIPTYSKADEEAVLAARAGDAITPTLKFQDLLDRKISSVLVPLQEYVFKKWYYKRIFTLGDSAHKFNPISGHGGNACIESAATLINQLVPLLERKRGKKPTLAEVEQAFARTQEIRHKRAQTLCEHSHEQQRMEALCTPLHKFTAFYLLPLTDAEDVTFKFSGNMPLAEKLTTPVLPVTPRLVPYKDELLSEPKPRGAAKWLLIAFYLAVAALVHYGMWVRSVHYGLDRHLGGVLATGTFEADPSFALKRTYTGIQAVDDYLVFLAAIFMTGVNNWDKTFGMLQFYFLGMLLQPIAVWTAEAYRSRNKVTPLALVSLWLTLVQAAGIGIYMPVYYAVYTFVSEPEPYWWPYSRAVKPAYAYSLLAAVLVGYALPTVLMFVPWGSAELVQSFEALWQVAPMLVAPLCSLLGWSYATRHPVKAGSEAAPSAKQTYPDVAPLQQVYAVTGVLGALLHVYCMLQIHGSSEMSFASVFWPDFAAEPKSFAGGLTVLFLTDFWGFVVASFAWMVMAVYDLRRMGRTTVDLAKATVLIALGHVLVGPGATLSAVWYWREAAMAKTVFV